MPSKFWDPMLQPVELIGKSCTDKSRWHNDDCCMRIMQIYKNVFDQRKSGFPGSPFERNMIVRDDCASYNMTYKF
jgi:hypothetical protein